ncbi:hypothetical protein BDZ89DRAFT_989743 [Hymenopellis radicata]|nr:hypothetical protein BDZ89DRAFT_989743 [Hymenopellis radicata]
MQSRQSYARYNTFHGPKQQLLGNQAGHVAPAWRANTSGANGVAGSSGKAKQITNPGSKILLSRLPVDVPEKEVDELFKKTVGPLKESFLIYNSQGKSKGMAIVSFQHTEHAAVAKAKYDGKYIDGRRPIKIEIVTEDVTPPVKATGQLSLFERIAPANGAATPPTGPRATGGKSAPTLGNHALPRQVAAAASIAGQTGTNTPVPVAPRRRYKKGPKRLKKAQIGPASLEQLDQEMEDYRASADASNVGS